MPHPYLGTPIADARRRRSRVKSRLTLLDARYERDRRALLDQLAAAEAEVADLEAAASDA